MAPETDTAGKPRTSHRLFIRVVGGLFLAAGAMGLLVSAGQVAVLTQPLPGSTVDPEAWVLPLGVALASCFVVVVSLSFLRRLRWARSGLLALAALGILASLLHLLVASDPIEAPPPEAPEAYTRLLDLIAVLNVVGPVVACLGLAYVVWRLRAPSIRDQFH